MNWRTIFLVWAVAWSFVGGALAEDDPALVFNKKSLSQWMEVLENGESGESRREAAQAIAIIAKKEPAKSKAAIPVLITALKDDFPVRRQASHALGHFGAEAAAAAPDLVAAFREDKGTLSGYSLALERLGSAGVPQLAPYLLDKDERVRRMVATVFRNLGPESAAALPQLKVAVTHSDAEVRHPAEDAMLSIGEPAIPHLLVLVKHKNEEVRSFALGALGHIGKQETKVVPAVVAIVKGKRDSDFRDQALGVLAKYRTDAAIIGIAGALEDPDLHGTAEKLLIELGPAAKRAVPVLLQVVRRTDGQQEVLALAKVLIKIDSAEALRQAALFRAKGVEIKKELGPGTP